MKASLFIAVAVVLASTTAANNKGSQTSSNNLIVQTAQGRLRGSILTSRKGKQIYSFRGVRFAQPPIGNLRFKAPVPPESWRGIRDATEDAFACPQPWTDNNYTTSEDCLFLNVYTTALPTSRSNPNRPVLVYFHAGGWFFYTGLSSVHGPQYLMDQDIVLVVPNYRLGALGFLSTGDNVLHGNYGMKDQVATLRWIRQNIAAFGGNPKEVTIAGCSAGGASVWFHMISPMSRGLFNKGISMSMGLNSMWAIARDPLASAKRQADLLNCPNDTSTHIAECVKQKDAQEIASTYLGNEVDLIRQPVIEKDYGQERFLTENPMKTFLDGNFMKIPWMTGLTKDEYDSWAYDSYIQNQTYGEQLAENFEGFAPLLLEYEQGTERSRQASRAFRKLYLNDQPITNSSRIGIGRFFSDALIRYGYDTTSKLASQLSGQPVYAYQFEYLGRYSFLYIPGTQTPYGVIHHDDIMYLFYVSELFSEFKPEDPETKIVEKLTTLWANFIYTGNPTPKASEVLDNVIWESMTAENLVYLSIDSELKMNSGGLYQDRMALWRKYFPPQLQTSSKPNKSG